VRHRAKAAHLLHQCCH